MNGLLQCFIWIQKTEIGSSAEASSVQATIKSATMVLTSIPIILVYPFVQKYFVKGMTIGAIKG